MKKLHALILVSASALACSDRLVSTDDIPVDPFCVESWGTRGYWLDGTSKPVYDDNVGAPHACVCITEEQWRDEDERARLTEPLVDELLIECERIAAQQGFDWNECQTDHDSGYWGLFAQMAHDEIWAPSECPGKGWVGTSDPYPDHPPPIMCDLGDPGCSCTVQATCTGGATCIDGMCVEP